MENTVEVRIDLPLEEVQNLADLAGGDEYIGEYLTQLIRKLHTEQCAILGDLRLKELVHEAELLTKKRQEYKETIRTLKARLRKLTMSHAELMAIVKTIGNNSSSSANRVH